MKGTGNVGAVLVLLLAMVQPLHADCDRCEDLCRLIDQYHQREKGIEIFKAFAASTPKEQRRHLPPTMMSGDGVELLAIQEFGEWTSHRQFTGELPCQPVGGGGGTAVEAVTNLGNCQMMWEDGSGTFNQVKTIDTQASIEEYEKAIGCKAIADATIEHERVHQTHCKAAHASNQAHFLDEPDFIAESELQAWNHQKDLLGDAIHKILREQGCGWDPTERQKADPSSVPSPAQTRKMEQGWKAIKALRRPLAP